MKWMSPTLSLSFLLSCHVITTTHMGSCHNTILCESIHNLPSAMNPSAMNPSAMNPAWYHLIHLSWPHHESVFHHSVCYEAICHKAEDKVLPDLRPWTSKSAGKLIFIPQNIPSHMFYCSYRAKSQMPRKMSSRSWLLFSEHTSFASQIWRKPTPFPELLMETKFSLIFIWKGFIVKPFFF